MQLTRCNRLLQDFVIVNDVERFSMSVLEANLVLAIDAAGHGLKEKCAN